MKNLTISSVTVFLSALIAFASSAADTNVFYTVTVDNGTQTEPVSLDTLSVTVERPDAEPQTRPFSEACADFADGPAIFRKRGRGWMMSSVKMAEFTGEIRVEEGVFMVNTNLMTGPQSVDIAPAVVVSNGATFALASTKETLPRTDNTKGLRLYNHFKMSGRGVDDLGAMANMLGTTEYYCFNNDWTLYGDTLFSGTSKYRVDITERQNVYMNGHTLTVKSAPGGVMWSLFPNSARFFDGHIVADGINFGPQSIWDKSWETDENNTLTLTNKAILGYYNTGLKIPWTLIMNEGSEFSIGGRSDGSYSDLGNTNKYGRWDGPLEARGSVRICGTADRKGLVLDGPLLGTGPVNVGAGWLQLLKDSPDYKGSITVNKSMSGRTYRAGLALYTPGAYCSAASGVAFTNAELRLMSDDIYDLPPVTAHVSSGTNYQFAGGLCESRYASLLKTGGGTLDLLSPVTITGRFEIAEGTVRLPPLRNFRSLAGGLWKSAVHQDPTNEVSDTSGKPLYGSYHDYMNNAVFHSNEVVSCCDMMRTPTRPPWETYTSYAWGGYIWNRSPTNETWRFAVGVTGYSRLYIDNVRRSYSDDNSKVDFINVELSSGPHPFLFKVNSRGYNHPGSIDPRYAKNKEWKKDGFGLAVSRTSTTSTNSDDFVFLDNTANTANRKHPGGDGFLFTLDDREISDFDEHDLIAAAAIRRGYSNLVCRAGTVIDLGEGNETPLVTTLFEGVTTITNGGLTVYGSWKLKPMDLAGGSGALKVLGKIEFRPGVTLEWEELSLLPRREYVIAVATGGISGIPSWAPADGNHAMWRLSKDKDPEGNGILTFKWHAGTTVVIR